jgi:hypothetical protein
MKVRNVVVAVLACGVTSFALGAGPAQARTPKPKVYTYCATLISTQESECFAAPFNVFHKTHTWIWNEGEEVSGTYTMTGKNFVFRETSPESRDELIGVRGKHGVISGRLYENGSPGEFTFTLTPS